MVKTAKLGAWGLPELGEKRSGAMGRMEAKANANLSWVSINWHAEVALAILLGQ